MMTGHVFIATSLDGYIARLDGGLDWLFASDPGDEDHGYDAFIARMDGIIMGRGTYESVLTLGPWSYSKPVLVMSRSLADADVPAELAGQVRITDEPPRALFERLNREGWRRAYVDGGAVIRSCLAVGLIKDVILTRAPVLIGTGRPLFGPLDRDLRLVHERTQAFPSGLVQSHYSVAPPA